MRLIWDGAIENQKTDNNRPGLACLKPVAGQDNFPLV